MQEHCRANNVSTGLYSEANEYQKFTRLFLWNQFSSVKMACTYGVLMEVSHTCINHILDCVSKARHVILGRK